MRKNVFFEAVLAVSLAFALVLTGCGDGSGGGGNSDTTGTYETGVTVSTLAGSTSGYADKLRIMRL
jgi:hypothetical protein